MVSRSIRQSDRRSGGREALQRTASLLFYLAVAVTLGLSLTPPSSRTASFLATLGVIGTWRYGWAAVHLARAWFYRRHRFPALRAAADRAAGPPPPLFILITAYRQDPLLTARVFRSVAAEAASYGADTTIVVAVTDPAERRMLDHLTRRRLLPSGIRVVIIEQDGSGKRSALAEGLRAIARRIPSPDALLVMMDGDTTLAPGTLRRTFPFFRLDPSLSAVTVDVEAEVSGSVWARDWFRLRYAQRHLLMCSLSLSRRLLVLTGRFSVFRAAVATEPEFIRAVEEDCLRHWRHGRVRFLTGDDKSTWYWLLRRGCPMIYLPDVRVRSVEVVADGQFFSESVLRMRRWFGNMLRNNGRALALGPRRIPLFVWWCLADQRVSMWTSLSGPAFALTAAAFGAVGLLPAYLLWVMLSRFAYAAGLALVVGGLTFRWPLLLYYGQVAGALVKVVASFSLNRQAWARQQVGAEENSIPQAFWNRYLAALAIGAFIYVSSAASADLRLPDRLLLAGALGEMSGTPTTAAEIQTRLDAGGLVHLPAGIIDLDRPLVIRRDDVRLIGAGMGRTVLRASFEGEDTAVLDVAGPSPSHMDRRACARSTTAARPSDVRISFRGGSLPATGFVWMGAPNDKGFLESLGADGWDREYPWLRQSIAAFTASQGELLLARPLGTELPEGALLCPIGLLQGIEIAGLTVDFALGGRPRAGDYTNARPGHRVDGIRVVGAAAPRLSDVSVENAGRHALNLDGVLAPSVRRFDAEGAWNKGPGGNGYLRIARTYHGHFTDVTVRGLRHIAIQWSSHGNRLTHLDSDTDVNFHGGFSRDNQVVADRLAMRPGHPWAGVTRTPGEARWAPPDGSDNTVTITGGGNDGFER